MNKLLLMSALFLMTNLFGVELKAVDQPTVQKDSVSESKEPKHLVHYLSAIGGTVRNDVGVLTQHFTPTVSPFNFVAFNKDVVQSIGFRHPVNGDNTKFLVEHSGIYLLSYDLSINPLDNNFTAVTFISLNGTVLTSFPPASITNEAIVRDATTGELDLQTNGSPRPISVTTIVRLNRGDILQLVVENVELSPFDVDDAKIIITEISRLP